MEIELGAYRDHIMLVEMGYGRPGPNETHDQAVEAFDDDRLRDWLDSRIPDSFRVRVWNSTEDPSTIKSSGEFAAMVTRLALAVPAYENTLALGTALPEPDRSMYVNQTALNVAMDLWDEDKFPDFTDFMLQPKTVPKVRTDLQQVPGVTATESNVHAFPIMFAYQRGLTAPKVRRRLVTMDNKGLKRASSDLIGLPPNKKQKTTT